MPEGITLPEITIVGDPDYQPHTPEEWFTEGFTDGYNGEEAKAPMVSEALVFYYMSGFDCGKQAASDRQAEIERLLEEQPQIREDLGGESFAKAQEEYNRLLEAVFHEHPPHTEGEGEPGAPQEGDPAGLVVPGDRPPLVIPGIQLVE